VTWRKGYINTLDVNTAKRVITKKDGPRLK